MKNILITIFLALSFSNCQKESTIEQYLVAAQVCLETRIVDSLELKNHLVGQWELVYSECGLCVKNNNISGNVVFEENHGVLDLDDETISSMPIEFEWWVKPILSTDGKSTYYILQTEPYLHPLRIWGNICEDFMVHDARANDGGYHLFKKL